MKKYRVKITEELSRIIEQEADSMDEAIALVEEKYNNEEIVLDYSDCSSIEFSRYPLYENKKKLNNKKDKSYILL